GEGPTPSAPSEATVLVTASPAQSCNSGTYIGPVAFGSDHVYVSFLPYQAQGGSCNGGGGGNIQAPQTVYGAPLAGGALEKIGSAGVTNDGHVQLVATGSGVAYAFNEMQSTNLSFEPGHQSLPSMMGTNIPLGMFAIGNDVYVGTLNMYMTNSGASVAAPNFPNYSGTMITAQSPGEIWHVGSGSAGSWSPQCGALDRCLVANGSAFTYLAADPGVDASLWSLLQVPLGGTTPTKIANAPHSSGLMPLGLDMDDHQVAWSTTESCAQPMGGSFSCHMTTCNVFIYDSTATMPAASTLLATQQFACVDAKLANGYVYFAIVEVSSENQVLIGRGIGRVHIADRSVETLDLGILAPGYGPHRVFPIGDQLYLVDPFVLARIPASALDGKHDFTP
ncbi:MAG: hypothetical protein JO257_23670, partial [Deltaproteobacteria bacterium]|nr:hypothetical protein [Deltaproteobacteria bacterium]